jgi:sec-independent protein translocase protein TatC
MAIRFRFFFKDRTVRRASSEATPTEDLFAETRMPFGDHLEDLRRRLLRVFAGLGAALVLVFLADLVGYLTDSGIGIARLVMDLITRPVEHELQCFYDRRVRKITQDIQAGRTSTGEVNVPVEVHQEVEINDLIRQIAPRLGMTPPTNQDSTVPCYVPIRARINPLDWTLALSAAQRLLGKRPSLQTMSITEAMMVYVQVAVGCGLMLASPWIFWQFWAFLAPGLYPHEKRPFRLYLPFSIALFLTGVVVCQLLVIPQAIDALLWFNEWLDLNPTLRLNEWIGFAVFMPVLFGIVFQMPLVMLFLQRLELISVDAYRDKRRLAWLVMTIGAAVATPTNDLFTMLYLLGPMCFLYELGILLCRLASRSPEQVDAPDPSAEEVTG